MSTSSVFKVIIMFVYMDSYPWKNLHLSIQRHLMCTNKHSTVVYYLCTVYLYCSFSFILHISIFHGVILLHLDCLRVTPPHAEPRPSPFDWQLRSRDSGVASHARAMLMSRARAGRVPMWTSTMPCCSARWLVRWRPIGLHALRVRGGSEDTEGRVEREERPGTEPRESPSGSWTVWRV